ncbi:Rad60/SUMO-like domain-containing protein [Caenorhabditis elegans]|uniref:Rad60/SUMO-like domain-containing protein n=1 Tax=Caenorhabditis elegans TaxID=6239 RepID=Q22144_CAEEL|nr:Rad60/SUMO-like domain-containing protein [Caenorhabditis elegans]CAA84734.1 Rad60/SUMO-like domain-containing protein [Caenorhabditis elegans]|eukprot:NP_497960.1 Uncharacterized protein CELE_T04A8.8 [Caenorhabditis elegans]
MSDSDDNAYSDYLGNRRAALQKKRQPVRVCESDDSDDDFDTSGPSPMRKKTRETQLFPDDSDDDECVEVEKETYSQKVRHEIDDVEEAYRRSIYKRETVIHAPVEKNNVISGLLKICEGWDEAAKSGAQPEVEDVKDDSDADESSIAAENFPVTVVILDCESHGNDMKSRHDIFLESTFSEIRRIYATKWGCPVSCVVFSHNGKTIDTYTTPQSLGWRPMTLPHPLIEASKEAGEPAEVFTIENSPDSFTIKVLLASRRKPVQVEAAKDTTIQEILQKVIDAFVEDKEENIPSIESMKVVFDNERIKDVNITCEQLDLEDDDCIEVYF